MYDLKNTEMIIYKITNIVNRKCYIGQTIKTFEKRYEAKGEGIERVFNYHNNLRNIGRPYNEHLLHSIEKYGFENFTIEILEVCKTLNKLNKREEFYIKKYKSSNPEFGYNKTSGGDGIKRTRDTQKYIVEKSRNTRINRITSIFNTIGIEEVKLQINSIKYKKLTTNPRRIMLTLLCFSSLNINKISLKELKTISCFIHSYKNFVDELDKLQKRGHIVYEIKGEDVIFKILNDVQSNSDCQIHIKTKYLVEMKTYIEVNAKYFGKNVKIKKCLICEKEVVYSRTNNQKYCEYCGKKVKYSQRGSSSQPND